MTQHESISKCAISFFIKHKVLNPRRKQNNRSQMLSKLKQANPIEAVVINIDIITQINVLIYQLQTLYDKELELTECKKHPQRTTRTSQFDC